MERISFTLAAFLLAPTPILPLSEPLFSPSCAPTVKSNFLATMNLLK
jgi:hypothetical protein